MGERYFRGDKMKKIGSGSETPVFSLEKSDEGRERNFVVKTYEWAADDDCPEQVADENGFNDALREEIFRKQQLLERTFGPYIPKSRILKNIDAQDNRYVFVQERLDLPPNPDIFGFKPEDFQDDEYTTPEESEEHKRTRAQLLDFARRLKEQLIKADNGDLANAVIIDLDGGRDNHNNIVLDRVGNVFYVDISAYTLAEKPGWSRNWYIMRIKEMELLGGKTQSEIDADPFYQSE